MALSVSPDLAAKVQSLMNADLVSVVTCANGHFIDLDVHKPSMSDAAIDAFCKTKTICAVERQALAFLAHFVGDIHQPLHAAERDNDFGGGGVNVRFNGMGRGGRTEQQATEIAAAKTEKVPPTSATRSISGPETRRRSPSPTRTVCGRPAPRLPFPPG